MSRHCWKSMLATLAVAAAVAVPAARASAQAIALSGVGPINRSMGGAATAAPIDAMGAIHWNPATISALPTSQLSVGYELLLADEHLSSRVEAGALGQGFPPVPLQGSTEGEPGVAAIPNAAFTYRPDDSCLTYGLGILGVGGFTANYPASATNPVLTPQAPLGVGLGRLEARAEILQIVPTLACQLTDRLHVGVAPTVTVARISASPLFLAAPNDANDDDYWTYGPGSGTRYHWGGGFQIGAYYETQSGLNLGVAFKSPQWMEDLRYQTTDELGMPQVAKVDFEYPLIVTLGASYCWRSGWLTACDVRFFNYSEADGFGPTGYRSDLALSGLGWNDIWSIHLGAQRVLNDRLTIRLGYSYNESPITSDTAFFNAVSPLISQHIIYVGASVDLTCCVSVDLMYAYAFENSVSGPWVLPGAGALAGTSVKSTISAHALAIGSTVRF